MIKKVAIELQELYLPVQFESEYDSLPIEQMKRLASEAFEEFFSNPANLKKIKVKSTKVLPKDYLEKKYIKPGRVIRTHENEIGIITGIKKSIVDDEKPISVVLAGHRIRYFRYTEVFESAGTFLEARCIRMEDFRELNLWHEGDSCYLKTTEGLLPVVVGKTARNKTQIHLVTNSNDTKTWELPHDFLNMYLVEFKSDEEKKMYESSDTVINHYRTIFDTPKEAKLSKEEKLTIFLKSLYSLQPAIYEQSNDKFKSYLNNIEYDFSVIALKIKQLNSKNKFLSDDIATLL